MKQRLFVSVLFVVVVIAGAARLAGQAQTPLRTPEEEAARKQAIARNFENNARRLTEFDREGNVTRTIGERGLYNQPVYSADRTKIAVIKNDLEKETVDVWVTDVATGTSVQITATRPREGVSAPAWSADGKWVAYAGLRGSFFTLMRKAADGTGEEEVLYQHPGGGVVLTDWSLDGRVLSFYATDLTGASLYLLPLDGDRKPIEVARSESQIIAARLSPDNRFLAYRSNESGRNEIWVRSVPPPGNPKAPVDKWQVSRDGGLGMVFWRRDGKELYYLGGDRGVMAVEVNTNNGFEFSRPRRLFNAPDSIPVTGTPGALGNVSRDGERVVFAVPPAPQLRQITVFDRSGKVVNRLGAPALYDEPALSPDGGGLAIQFADQRVVTSDIIAFDLTTGRRTAVTNDAPGEGAPVWTPDGKYVAYVATRGQYSAVYRRPWDGSGTEEMLFRYTPGAGMGLTDFSPDGRFLSINGGGLVAVVPLAGTDPLKRQTVDFARSEFDTAMGRFSPDGRFLAYGSNEVDNRFDLFLQGFDPATGGAAGPDKVQLTKGGTAGALFWRRDGKEFYYLRTDQKTSEVSVVAVDVETAPALKVGSPRVLFTLPGPLPGNPGQHITRDGERFVFVMPMGK